MAPGKIVVGAAMYGHWLDRGERLPGWQPFTGTATGPVTGTWENGVVDYRDIVNNRMGAGWVQGYDEAAEAPMSSRPAAAISSASTTIARSRPKGQYVLANQLGGLLPGRSTRTTATSSTPCTRDWATARVACRRSTSRRWPMPAAI